MKKPLFRTPVFLLSLAIVTSVSATTPDEPCRVALKAAFLPANATAIEYRAFVASSERAFEQCQAKSLPVELRVAATHQWAKQLRNRDGKAAEAIYRRAIQDIQRETGGDAAVLIPLLNGLMDTVYLNNGAPTEEVFTLARERVRIAQKSYGTVSAEAAEALLTLGRYHEINGSLGLAEDYYREAISTAKAACPSMKCGALSLAYTQLGEMLTSDRTRAAEANELKEQGEETAPPD
jgi:hypothetical protein